MFSFHEVTKDFKTDFWEKPFRALDNVSFSLKPGSIVGFLGANGAGKTTGIKILLNFIDPSSGNVEYNPILGNTKRDIFKNIGYLPERPYFYADLTGLEFLNYIGQLNDLSKADIAIRIKKWSEALKIDFALGRKLRFYSKGMLQRSGFVSALIPDPKLLILDEPLSGLDPLGRKEFKDIMNGLAGEEKTIFFSSHILSDVEEVSRDVVIMEKGKLIHSGNVLDLINEKSTNEFELIIQPTEVKVFEDRYKGEKKGDFQSYTFSNDELDSVMSLVAEQKIQIESLKKVTPTLEDIIYRIGV